MISESQDPIYVKVRDGAGNGFVCPLDQVTDMHRISEAELENCVEDDVAGRYAGQMKIVN
jgi:hypothetical protein